jgi:hypothetical protein
MGRMGMKRLSLLVFFALFSLSVASVFSACLPVPTNCKDLDNLLAGGDYIAPDEGVNAEAVGAGLSNLKDVNGKKVLYVDGKPFIILSVQAEGSRMDPAHMNDGEAARQFKYARDLGCNTIMVNIKWASVEQARDSYNWAWVDWVLAQAETQNLYVVMQWFGSNMVGHTNDEHDQKYVPDYVSGDTTTYKRIVDPSKELFKIKAVLDPSDPDTLNRERKAFLATLNHINGNSRRNRIIAWQILNEVGVWKDLIQPIPYTDEQLTAYMAAYVEALAAAEKSIFPAIPAYTNFWEGLRGVDLNYYLGHCPSLDFISPDLYGSSPGLFGYLDTQYRDFRMGYFWGFQEKYSASGNAFYLSETNTDDFYRQDISLMFVLGKSGGIGMSPWAVEWASPDRGEPLVDSTGALTASGLKLREVYSAVNAARAPLAYYCGTPDSAYLIWDKAPIRTATSLMNLTVGCYTTTVNAKVGSAIILIQRTLTDLIILGSNIDVAFKIPTGYRPLVEQGSWSDLNTWQASGVYPSGVKNGIVTIKTGAYVSLRLRFIK